MKSSTDTFNSTSRNKRGRINELEGKPIEIIQLKYKKSTSPFSYNEIARKMGI